MKKIDISWIICLIFILGLLSCTNKESTTLLPELAQAEAVMYEHPDSALHVLEGMNVPEASDKFQNATWCLLMTQAKYKNYIDQSDSLINIAYDYFIKNEDSQRKAMVLYYKGALCMEKLKPEEAQKFYLEATTKVEKTKDYQLAHLIYAGLGNVYLYRSLNEYSMNAFEKAYQYAKLSGHKDYLAYSAQYLARAYSTQSNWKEAIKYYKDAIQIAETIHSDNLIASSMSELAGIYTVTANYDSALTYARKALNIKLKSSTELEQGFLSIGDIFRKMYQVDSAYYYLNKAVLSNNIYTRRSSYQALYYLSKREKQYEKAVEYSEKMWYNQDSIQKLDRSQKLIEMQEKYDQEKIKNEKNQLVIEKAQTIRNFLIVSVILICIIAILIHIYQHKLIIKERTIQKKEEVLRSFTIKLHENEKLINRNQNRMKELMEQMEISKDMQEQLEEQKSSLADIKQQNEILKQENKVLQQNINEYSASLYEQTEELNTLKKLSEENIHLQDREKFLCNQLLKKTEILNNLKVKPQYIDDTLWEEVKEAINQLFDNYTLRLNKQIPSLTESDIQMCCLIKLRVSVSDIAILLAISPTSVSKRKQRLKERITQEIGAFTENQTIDLWLWEY